jgi:hypothetical protein
MHWFHIPSLPDLEGNYDEYIDAVHRYLEVPCKMVVYINIRMFEAVLDVYIMTLVSKYLMLDIIEIVMT